MTKRQMLDYIDSIYPKSRRSYRQIWIQAMLRFILNPTDEIAYINWMYYKDFGSSRKYKENQYNKKRRDNESMAHIGQVVSHPKGTIPWNKGKPGYSISKPEIRNTRKTLTQEHKDKIGQHSKLFWIEWRKKNGRQS